MPDYRFLYPGADARFPKVGSDTFYPSPGVNTRFSAGQAMMGELARAVIGPLM